MFVVAVVVVDAVVLQRPCTAPDVVGGVHCYCFGLAFVPVSVPHVWTPFVLV